MPLYHDRVLHLYTQAFVHSWLLSIAQRFLAMEPIIILVGPPLRSSLVRFRSLIYNEDLLAVTYTTVALTNDCRHYRPTTTITTLPALPLEAYITIHSLPPPHVHHQVGVLLPMLLASSHCANLFTESCNTLIGESFAICATFMQRLRQF